MKASVVDLRYRMKEVLASLERREEVKILYHGKVKGIISPVGLDERDRIKRRVQEHHFFGSWKTEKDTDTILDELRGGRF
jgi:hypothetical protein